VPAAALHRSLSAGDGLVIALDEQRPEALAMLDLDLRADPQRLVGLVFASGELVDPDDDARSAVDLLGDPVGVCFDLGLLEACSITAPPPRSSTAWMSATAPALRSPVIDSITYEPANGATALVTSDSYAMTCWARSASRAAFSVGRAMASS
jgi:hypothetical protein